MKSSQQRFLSYLFLIVSCAVLILIDQAVKGWTLRVLASGPSIPVIPSVFQLTYVENRGAAFGIFQGNPIPLGIVSLILVLVLFLVYRRIEGEKNTLLLRCSLILIIAGALGNVYDRLFRTFVVDLFDFCLIHFPVFNVADTYVVIGAGLLILFTLLHPDYMDRMFGSSVPQTAAAPVCPESSEEPRQESEDD